MNVPSSAPCFDSVSSSGKASKRMDDDSYKSAQFADLGELERANQSVDSWRRVASVEAIAVVAMVGLCAMLGSRPLQPPVVYHESENGLVLHRMEALTSLTADKVETAGAIVNYIKAYRNIPGSALAQAQQNFDLVNYMTKNSAPYHANSDVVAHFSAPENNPEQLGMNGVVRTVSNVVPERRTIAPSQIQEWEATWHEDVSMKPGQPTVGSEQHALIVIAANPQIKNNPDISGVASLDTAGVEVIQSDLR
jgi:type IV secretory pathway TrbF-like protein